MIIDVQLNPETHNRVINQKVVDLVCPCGKPLQLYKNTPGTDGREEWVLGHLNVTCSPLIHGGAEAVLAKMYEIQSLPTAKEFVAQKAT